MLHQGDWPVLKDLDVSDNCLDAEGMALLARGNWPVLRDIKLHNNPPPWMALQWHTSLQPTGKWKPWDNHIYQSQLL